MLKQESNNLVHEVIKARNPDELIPKDVMDFIMKNR